MVKSIAGKGMLVDLVVKTLRDRFKVVQQSLKRPEITKFNLMVLEPEDLSADSSLDYSSMMRFEHFKPSESAHVDHGNSHA